MKESFFINLKPGVSVKHFIHRSNCPFLPDERNRVSLGSFRSAREALMDGRKYFTGTESCPFCSKDQDTNKEQHSSAELHGNHDHVTFCTLDSSWESAMFTTVN
jgi:hypothetical protein